MRAAVALCSKSSSPRGGHAEAETITYTDVPRGHAIQVAHSGIATNTLVTPYT